MIVYSTCRYSTCTWECEKCVCFFFLRYKKSRFCCYLLRILGAVVSLSRRISHKSGLLGPGRAVTGSRGAIGALMNPFRRPNQYGFIFRRAAQTPVLVHLGSWRSDQRAVHQSPLSDSSNQERRPDPLISRGTRRRVIYRPWALTLLNMSSLSALICVSGAITTVAFFHQSVRTWRQQTAVFITVQS